MTSVSEMLMTLVNYMVIEEKKYLEQRLELSRLNLERMKAAREMQIRESSQPRYNKYPIELEKELIAYVQLGDRNKAKNIINRFLNEIFSFCEWRSGDHQGETVRILCLFIAQRRRGGRSPLPR